MARSLRVQYGLDHIWSAPPRTVAMLITPFLAHANEDALLDEARKVAMSLPPKLMVSLQEEIGRSGLEGAIPICKDMAPKMAGEISKETGWKIKRVSLKVRNDSRAIPDDWEKAALEEFDQRAAAGESHSLQRAIPFTTLNKIGMLLNLPTTCQFCSSASLGGGSWKGINRFPLAGCW